MLFDTIIEIPLQLNLAAHTANSLDFSVVKLHLKNLESVLLAYF